MQDDPRSILVVTSFLALAAFYLMVIGRCLVWLVRANLDPRQRRNPRFVWATRTSLVAMSAVAATWLIRNSEASLRAMLEDKLAAPVVVILIVTSCLLVLLPHAMVTIEFRRFKTPVDGSRWLAPLAIVVALASFPAAMVLVSLAASFVYVNLTDYSAPIVFMFDVPQAYSDTYSLEMQLFWIDRSIQSLMFGVPEVFGYRLVYIDPNDQNLVMSVLVIINKIMLTHLSLYMLFSDTIDSFLERKFAIPVPERDWQ